MFNINDNRETIRNQVDDWLHRHNDPRDPLTLPVALLLKMFLTGTNRRAVFLAGLGGALMAQAIGAIVVFAATRSAAETVVVPRGERDAMSAWIDSGEASRLMRCETDGLIYQNGRCRATDGGWLIPLGAQSRLEALAKSNPTPPPVVQPTPTVSQHSAFTTRRPKHRKRR